MSELEQGTVVIVGTSPLSTRRLDERARAARLKGRLSPDTPPSLLLALGLDDAARARPRSGHAAADGSRTPEDEPTANDGAHAATTKSGNVTAPSQAFTDAQRLDEHGQPCILALAVMSATLAAAADSEVALSRLKRFVRITQDLLPILGGFPTPDKRGLPVWKTWFVVIPFEWTPGQIDRAVVVEHINRGGQCNGIGEGRQTEGPVRRGTYRVASDEEWARLMRDWDARVRSPSGR